MVVLGRIIGKVPQAGTVGVDDVDLRVALLRIAEQNVPPVV